MAPLEAVHDPAMLRYLETCWADWVATGRTTPDRPRDASCCTATATAWGEVREPRTPAGRIGYWCFDTESPIVEGTWPATREAADVALTAAKAVLDGATAAYGLCRPPGHHAARRMFGGYCYVNNAAIVAEWLVARGAGRVGILDVDFHHGNGTQQLFWDRADVPYASLHGDPDRVYPYFSGHADETGGGAGEGFTRNTPLPAGTSDDDLPRGAGAGARLAGSRPDRRDHRGQPGHRHLRARPAGRLRHHHRRLPPDGRAGGTQRPATRDPPGGRLLHPRAGRRTWPPGWTGWSR